LNDLVTFEKNNFMKSIILSITLLSTVFTFGQNYEMDGSEIGFDLAFNASTFGGNAGIGLKYGFNFGESLIAGPSVRYERTWIKNNVTGTNGGFNVFGGGVFGHYRFQNVLFAGAEFEMLKSPYTKLGLLSSLSSWAPTFFVGGGFSREFNESFRINAGIMYDVINAENSPFKRSYNFKVKNEQGQVVKILPIIFRLAFFIPIS